MPITVKQLAELIQGKVQGNEALEVHAARALKEAQPGDITFLENIKHSNDLHKSQASVAVVPESFPANGKTVIQVADPLNAFVTIVRHLQNKRDLPMHGIDARADVHAEAVIGEQPSIHAFACIGAGTQIGARCRIHSHVVIGRNCKIGDDVTIHPGAVLYDDTVLGDRAIVHANSVLGADGFGYRFHQGKHVKVPQLGNVETGSDVEIGACACIDRGTFQTTYIGEGTKIDNLVQVAHNCKVGKHNLFVSQMGMAGSSSSDDYVVIAGQVGITDHVHIGKGAIVGAKAGVTKDVPAGEHYLGAPARPEREVKRMVMSLEKLPDLRKEIKRIKQHVGLDEAAD